jgi:2-octaprenyl-6-methoxyphenol hydroxylase
LQLIGQVWRLMALFDIAIVGGGSVALATALALRAELGDSANIVVLEGCPAQAPVRQPVRAYAIAPDVRQFLETLGVWRMVAAEAAPVLRMDISDGRSGDTVRLPLLDLVGSAEAPLAHILSESALGAALRNQVAVCSIGMRNFTLESFERTGARLRLSGIGGAVIEASLAIGADGVQSAIRSIAGIKTHFSNYRQSAVVASLSIEVDHEGRAIQHFLPGGTFALLPMFGRRYSLVWSLPRQEADALVKADPAEFLAAVQRTAGHAFGAFGLVEPPAAFPLRLQLARELVGERLLLVGDAAHVVHPLAGQGLNLGFRDAAAAARILGSAVRLGLDIGNAESLSRYQTERRFPTALMAATTDSLNRLFSNDLLPLRILRDVGFGVVNRIPALKRALVLGAAR